MAALIGRRLAAVLSATALSAAVVAGVAGAASAQPGPLDRPGAPAQPGPPVMVDPGAPALCQEIAPDGSVRITRGADDESWVTIERELPPGAVPAAPPAPARPADVSPGAPVEVRPAVPGDIAPPAPTEPECVVAGVR